MTRSLEDAEGPIPASINILDVLRGIGRRRLMVAGITLIAFVSAVGAVAYIAPVYTTESLVLIESQATPFDQVTTNQAGAVSISATGGADGRDIDTQIAVSKSDDIGRRVVAALKLDQNPSYNALLRSIGKVSQLKIMLGFSEDPRRSSGEDLALEAMKKGLTVYQIPNSNVIAFKVSASDAKIAADIANTLAETYANYTRESILQPTERARQWLAQQIDQLRGKVAEADAAVEKFRAQAGLLQGSNTTTLGNQQLSELNSQITLAEAAKTDAQSRADSIRNLLNTRGTVDASADVLSSAVIQGLKQQQTEAQRAVAELSAVYLPNHPKMIAAQKQLTNINNRIRSEALKIVEGLEEQANIAAAREESLRKSLDDLKKKAGGSNLDDVKLKSLERDAQANRALLETMLARYAEASSHMDPASLPGRAQMIQRAAVPNSPSFPKTGPMILLITIAGLALSLGLAFLLEIMAAAARLNERLAMAERLAAEEELQTPVTAAPSKPTAPPPLQEPTFAPPPAGWQPPPVPQPALAIFPAALNPGSVPPAASVEPVLAWLSHQRQSLGAASLSVASLGGGMADAATAAMAMARTLAARGSRVIAVDLSPNSPAFQQACGIPEGPGVTDLIMGTADFTKVISRDGASAAHVLRAGRDQSFQLRALLAERFPPVLAALTQSYEWVIVHLGEASSESPALMKATGAAVILAPSTRISDVTTAISALRAGGFAPVRHVMIGAPLAGQAAQGLTMASAAS